MEHADHVALLRGGVPGPGGAWADFGSGTGAFTLALAELIGPTGVIYSVDRDGSALRRQERLMRERFPAVTVHYLVADFTRPLELPPLDGVVMANALHFQRQQDAVLRLIYSYLRPGGRLILVEYNAPEGGNLGRGNPWVPYPVSYHQWERLARRNGFVDTRLLATRPSRFLGEIYSAVSRKPGKSAQGGPQSAAAFPVQAGGLD
jgi:ubiquinone/menaquinone biosynthesis C-methylase UbiE